MGYGSFNDRRSLKASIDVVYTTSLAFHFHCGTMAMKRNRFAQIVSKLDTILIKENGVAFRPLRKFCQLFVAVSFDTAKNSGIMRTKSCFSARRQPVLAAPGAARYTR